MVKIEQRRQQKKNSSEQNQRKTIIASQPTTNISCKQKNSLPLPFHNFFISAAYLGDATQAAQKTDGAQQQSYVGPVTSEPAKPVGYTTNYGFCKNELKENAIFNGETQKYFV